MNQKRSFYLTIAAKGTMGGRRRGNATPAGGGKGRTMKMASNRPRVGDQAWRVRWCSELAFDEAGDVDRDRCTESERRFRTRDEARAFAEQTWPATRETFGL